MYTGHRWYNLSCPCMWMILLFHKRYINDFCHSKSYTFYTSKNKFFTDTHTFIPVFSIFLFYNLIVLQLSQIETYHQKQKRQKTNQNQKTNRYKRRHFYLMNQKIFSSRKFYKSLFYCHQGSPEVYLIWIIPFLTIT